MFSRPITHQTVSTLFCSDTGCWVQKKCIHTPWLGNLTHILKLAGHKVNSEFKPKPIWKTNTKVIYIFKLFVLLETTYYMQQWHYRPYIWQLLYSRQNIDRNASWETQLNMSGSRRESELGDNIHNLAQKRYEKDTVHTGYHYGEHLTSLATQKNTELRGNAEK